MEDKLQEYYENAKAKGACAEALQAMEAAGTVEEFLKDAKIVGYLYWYADAVIGGRWPEAEPIIMKDAKWAYWYASDVMKYKRWTEAEPYIMKNAYWAYWYARNIMKDARWPEAEPYIVKDARWAYWYACDVIKGRWPEAEPYILESDGYTKLYCQRFGITKEEMNDGS